MSPAELLSDFPVVIEIPIQWGDQDAIGHVNNVVPLRWFESVRIAYFERLSPDAMGRADGGGFILAASRCDYRQQMSYPDTVLIGARVIRLGNTSLTFQTHAVSRQESHVAVEGESVVVLFDYATQEKLPISNEMRTAIERLERGNTPT